MENNLPVLGKLIEGVAFRDAVHIAIEPVVAACRLGPSSHVGLVDRDPKSGRWRVGWNVGEGEFVGIIDPFLTEPVEAGEQCYLFLFPGTVTSLRHIWHHSAFRVGGQRLLNPEELGVKKGEDMVVDGYDSGADLRNVK